MSYELRNSQSDRAYLQPQGGGGDAGWNINLASQNDARLASSPLSNGSAGELPPEFGNNFALSDASQSALVAGERMLAYEMQMVMQEFEQLLQEFQMLLNPSTGNWGSSGGSDASAPGSSSGDSTVGPSQAGSNSGTHQYTKSRQPDSNSQSRSDAHSNSGSKSNANSDSSSKSNSDSNSGSNSDANSNSNSNSNSDSNSSSQPGSDSSSSGSSSSADDSWYASKGIVKAKTIYHDDFNGAKGEHPNPAVFDTAHIGPDGQTRQRGASIDEDAIVSSNNSELDGKGDLQLFPTKQTTYDPVAKENVDYTTGSMNTGKGLHFNLKDYPNGLVVEVRAKHPTAPGSKFDALWLMTNDWAADPKKGQSKGDTIEYDAAEGGGADITVHYPTKDASGKSKDNYGGGAHPTDVNFQDGNFHTYTVVIKPNSKTGKGDVVEYVDGKQEFSQQNVFPADQDIHLRSSLEISPKWTHQTYTGDGGMNSSAAGVIDYLDVSELAPSK
ncbi:MAG TPA: hypothetical protein V6C72_15775 [Chroococcales cyanobacterium]